MLRFGTFLTLAGTLVLIGCHRDQATVQMEEAYTPLAQMEAQPAAAPDWYESDPPRGPIAQTPAPQPEPVAAPPPSTPEEELEPVGARTYIVRKGDTLYELARRFYNDQTRWRDIWEANRNRLRDPDRLRIGMKLIIP